MANYEPPRKKHKMQDYEFCYGAGLNWVDLNTGRTYFIQEYKEAIEVDKIKPPGIRWVDERTGETDYVTEYQMREIMKDPEPDPRTAPETLEEHRRNW